MAEEFNGKMADSVSRYDGPRPALPPGHGGCGERIASVGRDSCS